MTTFGYKIVRSFVWWLMSAISILFCKIVGYQPTMSGYAYSTYIHKFYHFIVVLSGDINQSAARKMHKWDYEWNEKHKDDGFVERRPRKDNDVVFTIFGLLGLCAWLGYRAGRANPRRQGD